MPVNYAQFLAGVPSPVDRVQEGFLLGQQHQDRRVKQRAADEQDVKEKAMNEEIRAYADQGNPTSDGLLNLSLKYPQKADDLKAPMDKLSKDEREATMSEMTGVFANLMSGRTGAAVDILERKKEAAENSRDKDAAAKADAMMRIIEYDPAGAKTMMGMQLINVLGPAKYEAMSGAFNPRAQSPEGKLMADERAGLVPEGTAKSKSTKDRSALQEKVDLLMSSGVDEETAKGIATGRFVASRHPVTGAVVIADKAQRNPAAEPAPEAPIEQVEPPNVAQALGPTGVAKTMINKVSDLFGGDLPFPETSEAATQLSNLNNAAIQLLRAGLGGRPNAQLQKRVEKLLVEPNEIFGGEQEAKNKFQALINTIDTEFQRLEGDIKRGGMRPVTLDKARGRLSELRSLSDKFKGILDSQDSKDKGDIMRFFK